MQKFFRKFPWAVVGGRKTAVPELYRAHFHHLVWDIAWWGLLAGSTVAFLNVYAARLGATAFQIGLLTAGPALVNLIFTLPAGRLLQKLPLGKAVFGAALVARMLFLVYVLLPLTLPESTQITVLIIATLLFNIPATMLAVGFNALFASAVPPEWRGYVAGRRNATISLVLIGTSLVSGYILNHTTLAVGYTIIFGIGFLGAAMSTYHLSRLRDITDKPIDEPPRMRSVIGDYAVPGTERGGLDAGQRINPALRVFTRGAGLMRTEVLHGGFGLVLLALFVFHMAQFMPAALFPLRWVDELHFNDGEIALGTAFFHGSVFVGSLFLAALVRRFGNHKVTVAGTGLLSIYPFMTALMPNLFFYLVTSVVGGQGWAFTGGALTNYLFEKVPAGDRPAYLAWYNLALNAAILIGALAGPMLAGWFGLTIALVLTAMFRLAGSIAIWLVEPKKTAKAA